MIDCIRGRLSECGEDWVVVDLGAVALRVQSTGSTLKALGSPGSQASLFTYLHLRDDVMALYGFATREERATFERLIGVTGIGPRAAQAMLSALSPTALFSAIDGENVEALVRVPGIGRKTAQRVILELKGKLVPLGASIPARPIAPGDDLIGVLMNLGYSAAEAAEALRCAPAQEGVSDEDRLRAALRHFTAP